MFSCQFSEIFKNTFFYGLNSVVYKWGALKHFAPWDIFSFDIWRYWKNLGSKNQTDKISKIHKDFKLYQVFMYNFLWQTVLIFLMYILFTKRTEAFWFRNISNTQDIRTYCFKYFKYILWYICTKIRKEKKIELFTKIFEL